MMAPILKRVLVTLQFEYEVKEITRDAVRMKELSLHRPEDSLDDEFWTDIEYERQFQQLLISRPDMLMKFLRAMVRYELTEPYDLIPQIDSRLRADDPFDVLDQLMSELPEDAQQHFREMKQEHLMPEYTGYIFESFEPVLKHIKIEPRDGTNT